MNEHKGQDEAGAIERHVDAWTGGLITDGHRIDPEQIVAKRWMQAMEQLGKGIPKPIDLREPWHPKPPALTPRVTTEDFSKGTVKPPAPLDVALRPMGENGERLRLTRKAPTTFTDAFIHGFVTAAIGCLLGFIVGMWVAVAMLS